MIKKKLLIGLVSLGFSQVSMSETNLSYPELDVTPRATERLNMLVEKESNSSVFSQLPMQISALSTLTTGLLQLGSIDEKKDTEKKSPNAGILVGAAWIGINYYVGQKFQIYANTMAEVNKVQGKTTRDQLIRERLAEEGINRAASLATRLKWISVGTNFGANAFMISKVKKDTAAQYVGVFSLVASLAPIFFVSDWETVAADQQSYKKKVYGPIFTTSLFETSEGKFSPGFLLTSTF